MLVATEMHDEPAPAQLSEARDRRQPRSHRPAHLAKAVANIVPHGVYADVIFDRIDAFVRAVASMILQHQLIPTPDPTSPKAFLCAC